MANKKDVLEIKIEDFFMYIFWKTLKIVGTLKDKDKIKRGSLKGINKVLYILKKSINDSKDVRLIQKKRKKKFFLFFFFKGKIKDNKKKIKDDKDQIIFFLIENF